jgi:hypothetical protein
MQKEKRRAENYTWPTLFLTSILSSMVLLLFKPLLLEPLLQKILCGILPNILQAG